MPTTAPHRLTAALTLTLTLSALALLAAPDRIADWTRTSRGRGDVVGWVILAAGAAGIAIMIIGYLQPKVQEYLNRIQ
ncbi:hypothetical protein [Nocardia transvalensis]|uniref:hypothetical protein n=1 Tax=Nocardia transvalensis TaxID=37333 RepID=UPI0018941DF2|nr:hypothetical protein [Nocardia transvalensis]MBF6333624.1 hypothetical protein [Nocardia transvalensis]